MPGFVAAINERGAADMARSRDGALKRGVLRRLSDARPPYIGHAKLWFRELPRRERGDAGRTHQRLAPACERRRAIRHGRSVAAPLDPTPTKNGPRGPDESAGPSNLKCSLSPPPSYPVTARAETGLPVEHRDATQPVGHRAERFAFGEETRRPKLLSCEPSRSCSTAMLSHSR